MLVNFNQAPPELQAWKQQGVAHPARPPSGGGVYGYGSLKDWLLNWRPTATVSNTISVHQQRQQVRIRIRYHPIQHLHYTSGPDPGPLTCPPMTIACSTRSSWKKERRSSRKRERRSSGAPPRANPSVAATSVRWRVGSWYCGRRLGALHRRRRVCRRMQRQGACGTSPVPSCS